MSSANDNELRDWLALSFIAGIGSRTAAQLIVRFGSPTECIKASPAWLEAAGLKAERDLKTVGELGGEILTLADPRYPPLLRETYDPPIVLYSLGDLDGA